MKKLLEFTMEDGSSIFVEVDEPEQLDGTRRVSRSGDLTQKAQISFEEALEKIKPVASSVIKKLKSLNEPADEVEVKFGLKMNAEAGVIIASASIEANYEVTLKWKRNSLN